MRMQRPKTAPLTMRSAAPIERSEAGLIKGKADRRLGFFEWPPDRGGGQYSPWRLHAEHHVKLVTC